MPKCKQCGKEFKFRFRSNEIFCSEECCKAFHGIVRKKERFCVVCGEKLKFKQQKYCSDICRNKAATLRQMEKGLVEEKEVPKVVKKRKKPKYTLDQVQALARQEGLSYGQYVAKYGL